MGERGYVLETGAENSRRNPARELRDPARLGHCVEDAEEGMETKHAATGKLALIVDGEQEGVGQQEVVQRVGSEITRVDVVHHLVVKESVEQQIQQQDEVTAVRGR